MKTTVSSQENSRSARNGAVKTAVCELLAWDELAYTQFQYDMGNAYLQYYLPKDVQGVNLLTRDRMFWAWWVNHWIARDEQFVNSITGKPVSRRVLLCLYLGLNDPATLATEIYPNGVILGEFFEKYMAQTQTA
jgi:hypothetical protein